MRNRSQDDRNRGAGYGEGYRPGHEQERGWNGRERDDDRSFRDRSEENFGGTFDGDRSSRHERDGGYAGHDDRRFQDSRAWRNDERENPTHRYGGTRENGWTSPYGQGDSYQRREDDRFAGGYRPGSDYGRRSEQDDAASPYWRTVAPTNNPWEQQGRGGRQDFQPQGQDSQIRRGFAGKGPKGYTRSDDRIREEISDALMADDDVDASEIEVRVEHGEVTLTGTVDSRQEKRAAEEVAERCQGVNNVQNSLRVVSSSGQSGSQSGGRQQSAADRQENARIADGEGQPPDGGRERSTGNVTRRR